MADQIYTAQSSHVTSDIVTPFVLEESNTTRKVAYAKLVNNPNDKDAYVHCTILHERKSRKGTWEPVESINLATLKSGEGVRFDLSCAATKELKKALDTSYAVGKEGLPKGHQSLVVGSEDEVVFINGREKEYIKKLIDGNYGEDIWRQLVESNPDLATKLSYAQIQASRKTELKKFEYALAQDYDESYWQKLLSEDDWIFGYGLSYYCLTMLNQQVLVGGKDIMNRNGQVVDFLAASEGHARYVVLVEIKKPSTPLLGSRCRNHAFPISSDLADAVAQVQGYIEAWGTNTTRERFDYERDNNLMTAKPKGILVIGNTSELDTADKKRSFELFRKGLNQIDIITYDELLERANHIVGTTTPELSSEGCSGAPYGNSSSHQVDYSDLPF